MLQRSRQRSGIGCTHLMQRPERVKGASGDPSLVGLATGDDRLQRGCHIGIFAFDEQMLRGKAPELVVALNRSGIQGKDS